MSTVERFRRNPLLRKVIVTLVTGVTTYTLANLINVEFAFEVGVSIFLSGVVFVVMYLLEVDQRLDTMEDSQQRHATTTENLLKERFDKFSRATGIFAKLEASDTGTEKVMKLVDDISALQKSDKLVFNFAQAEIQRSAKLIRDLTHGNDSMYEGEDRDWMLNLTRSVCESIDAISLTTVDLGVDGGMWLTDLGQRYLQLQRDAIGRGVTIRRVFVAEDANTLQKPEFLEICEMHRRLDVQVKILDQHDAPGTRMHTMFDFIVFDNALSYESTPVSQRTSNSRPVIMISTRLLRDETTVQERVQRFAELWKAARDLPD